MGPGFFFSESKRRNYDISHNKPGFLLFLLAFSLEWLHTQLDSSHWPGRSLHMCSHLSFSKELHKAQDPKKSQSCPFFLNLGHFIALSEFSGIADSSVSMLILHKSKGCHARFLLLLSRPYKTPSF